MNRFRPNNAWRTCLAWAVVLLSCAGCSFPYKLRVDDYGGPSYDRVNLVYEVDADHGALAPRFTNHTPGDIITFPRQPSSPVESAILKLEYPHPFGSPAYARVTIRTSLMSIDERRKMLDQGFFDEILRTEADEDQLIAVADPAAEVFELALTKQELDLLLLDLARTGFFDPNLKASGGARLSVEIDGGHTEKTWLPEPRLDDIITRLRTDEFPVDDDWLIPGEMNQEHDLDGPLLPPTE